MLNDRKRLTDWEIWFSKMKDFWKKIWEKLQDPKVWIPCVAGVVILIASGIGLWVYFDYKETQRLDAESVVLNERLVIEVGEARKVSDFLESLNGTLVDDFLIEPGEPSEVEVNFEYINVKNRKRPAKFTVRAVDTTVPEIYGNFNYTLNTGFEGDLTDLMISGDNIDDHPKREVSGSYDLNRVGSYKLEYVITDASGNQAVHPFTLNIVEPSGDTPEPYIPEKLPLREVIRDYKTADTKIGIDVSQWQGEIDWQKVKNAGVEFAFIRIGYQNGFGGEYVLDPYFQNNMQEASRVGLPVGTYFYSYADSVAEAVKQAEWVKEQLGEYEVELGVAFDWESWGEFNQAGISFRTINNAARTFLNKIGETGRTGLLYGSKVYLERIWRVPEYETWLAQYYHEPTYAGKYKFWQMSNSGQVDGIGGDVDIDIMYMGEN